MMNEDAIFEDICALSDEADAAGLADVALVLEFALDVFLKETGRDAPETSAGAMRNLERSSRQMQVRQDAAPHIVPRLGWTMSTFPLASLMGKAS
ncbi:hypothetical protein L0666_17075 [Octadecabacter sp. CECT 8868]|uniref:hypothetical protein n=1 Tax=Octadecabacter algicola TaxID=2909342 RepID=UPI001F455E05|nr:hypothetical protein [Octadecabacter algicola]MCF2906708.1 hypothetical protein [Octadecabacter algicola]